MNHDSPFGSPYTLGPNRHHGEPPAGFVRSGSRLPDPPSSTTPSMCKPLHPFRTILAGPWTYVPRCHRPVGEGRGPSRRCLRTFAVPPNRARSPSPASSVRAPAHPSAPRGPPDAGFRRRMGPNMYLAGRVPARPAQLSLRLDLPRPNPHSGEACLARTFGVPLRALSRPRLRRGTPSTGRVWVVHVRPIRVGSQLALASRGPAPAREPIHTSPVPRSPLSPNRPSALIATPPPISRSSSGRSAAPSAIHGTPNVWIHRETTPAPGTAGDPAARLCAPWDPGRITYDASPIAPSGTLDVRIPNVGRPRPPRRGRDPRRMNRRPPPLDLRRLSP